MRSVPLACAHFSGRLKGRQPSKRQHLPFREVVLEPGFGYISWEFDCPEVLTSGQYTHVQAAITDSSHKLLSHVCAPRTNYSKTRLLTCGNNSNGQLGQCPRCFKETTGSVWNQFFLEAMRAPPHKISQGTCICQHAWDLAPQLRSVAWRARAPPHAVLVSSHWS